MNEEPTIELDLPKTKDGNSKVIKVGSKVVSYDFAFVSRAREGEEACYIEGTVEGVCRDFPDCPRYAIRVERHVFRGVDAEDSLKGQLVFPPLNGTPGSLTGNLTDGVEIV